ncbi:MAG: SHOCT domain-containing protein [Desulfosporosinus sp.]|nr:SHOCT domain-containing protein [Desulfosporosinus sp.]
MGWGMTGNWGNMMSGGGYGGYGNGGYWWMGIMGMVMQLLIVIGVILLVMYLFRHIHRQPGVIGRQNSGLDILRERYARGEIDSAEYQIIKRDLESK